MSDHDEEDRVIARSPGRREYDDINAALGRHIEKTEKRLSNYIRGGIIAGGIIGMACTISLVAFGFLFSERDDTVRELKRQAVAIQEQRKESIRRSCNEQNKRNSDTSVRLVLLAGFDERAQKTPEGKLEVARRRNVTLELIDALAPKENCSEAVRKAVQTK